MSAKLKIALAQIKTKIGDLAGNKEKILAAYDRAEHNEIDLLIFPEMSISGYYPADLLLKHHFLEACKKIIEEITAYSKGKRTAMLLGTPWFEDDGVYNAALLIEDGKIEHVELKKTLASSPYLNEKLHLVPSVNSPKIAQLKHLRLGILISDDLWDDFNSMNLAAQSAKALIVINSSPFKLGVIEERLSLAISKAAQLQTPIIFVNAVHADEAVVYDGGSFIIDHESNVRLLLKRWQEVMAITEWKVENNRLMLLSEDDVDIYHKQESEIYNNLCFGLKEFFYSKKYKKLLVHIDGSVEALLSAVIAADSLGPDKVILFRVSAEKFEPNLARQLEEFLDKLKIENYEIGFSDNYHNFKAGFLSELTGINKALEAKLCDKMVGQRFDNLGLNLLAEASNNLLLNTESKSWLAIGLGNVYRGKFSVTKDLYRTQICALASWRNGNLPEGTELDLLGLFDEKLLGYQADISKINECLGCKEEISYETLDKILFYLHEKNYPVAKIGERGFDKALIEQINKRYLTSKDNVLQAPPGVKISKRDLASDFNMPLLDEGDINSWS